MAVNPQKKITISGMIPFLVFVLFFSIMIWQKYRSSYEVPQVPPLSNTDGNRSVTLFFAADGIRLAREARVLDHCDADSDCLKSILDELLSGPVSDLMETIPDGVTVISASIEGTLAVVDFNNTFFDSMPSGSSAEMLAVYSVVNTIGANFPLIQKIKIDISSNKASLLRHLDLSEPLEPDYSLEQQSVHEVKQENIETTKNRKGATR